MKLPRVLAVLALLCAGALVVELAHTPAEAAVRADHDVVRFVAKGVNLAATGSTVVVPAQARKWRTTRVDVHVKTVTGFISVASASLGSNSTSFNNAVAIAALGAASTVDSLVAQASLVVLDAAVVMAASGLQFKVTTPAVSTTMTADVHVAGYFTEP